jgi:hypothetical protein
MTFKTLSAIAVLTAALGTPVFAQDTTAHHKSSYATRHFRNAYNRAPGLYSGARAGDDWFTESYGLDRSFPGGRDPDFNPPGN